MKKVLNIAFFYALLGLVSGVYYREFTKMQHFTGETQLSVVHTHSFALGMIIMLIVYLYCYTMKIHTVGNFNAFFYFYNSGVISTICLMLTRGTLQVLEYDLSSGLDSMISGIAGLGHIAVTIGIVLFFLVLRKNHAENVKIK
ncbi:DUF2871 domain-containing protein [Bacillus sp. B1-b2]|uniref:DUF2871 domain-containing protein n=1 Tax=Bacillus sp. B1-b2 TaxID=2653201 RepID=UPI0012617E2D|nr:DUF2871 domain-containing protein [Bacillus sp. B1-b2]KAB7668856.1 DUF2871 domain-containing protein [Bacillus sp. B1-b2]